MINYKCKSTILNENIVVCQIPKIGDFMTLRSISIAVENIRNVKLCSHDNILWQVDKFEDAKKIEIPICEPIIFCCELRLEFHFAEPVRDVVDIFVWFDLRYDEIERKQRYEKQKT